MGDEPQMPTPPPSAPGTSRDFGNMLNMYIKKPKKKFSPWAKMKG